MKIGLGIGIPFIRNYISSIFDPSKLFTGNTQGVWYDPSDINLTWRRNLLTKTEQFDNAAWSKFNVSVTANSAIAPDGTSSADSITELSGASYKSCSHLFSTKNTEYTFSCYAKANTRSIVVLNFYSAAYGDRYAVFDLTAGTVGVTASGITASISNATNGWYKCAITYTFASDVTAQANIGPSNSNSYSNYTGDGTSGIYVWGAQLELGSTATPYQRITDGIKDYLDYNPLPILYQDSAGTVPVTAVERPVGLMLDKSKGLVLGPELVTNGDFSQGATGWVSGNASWSISGGVASNNGTNNVFAPLVQNSVVTSGKFYVVEWDQNITSGSVNLWFAGSQAIATSITGSGRKSYKVRATVSGSLFFEASIGGVLTIDNISVRELPGNHAFNPSGNSANFPVLSARYNLLTKTEQFDNAVWNKSNGYTTVTANAATAPDGTVTADKLIANATNNAHLTYQSFNYGTGSYRLSLYVKAAEYSKFRVQGNSSTTGAFANFDLSTSTYSGLTLQGSGWTNIAASVLNVGNGWYLCSITFDSSVSVAGQYYASMLDNSGNSVFTGDGTSGIYIWGADLRVANDALNQPAYQRVNTATDYDTVGFKPYLRFNGINQWLQTNNIDFSYGDKMFVSAGVRKLSDAATGMCAELSIDTAANVGGFQVRAPAGAAANYLFGNRGSVAQEIITASTYPAPTTNVFSYLQNLSANSSVRVNGTVFLGAGGTGGGNYGNYPLYIGARAGTSLWFNGRLYGLVVAGKQASNAEITSTETYLNQRTGAY